MSQNRYEVLGKIADGGLGSVFKAYDRNLRREVALKRVRADSPEEAERQAEQLFEEARTISTLQHPHIVTVFDVGKDEEGAFIVMELLKGETLEDIIQRGALNEIDFRELVTQSLEGMIAAHATGLIHLDIKPQNFMVIWLPSGKFQIKILDFGLAKLSTHPQVQDMDEDGAIMGSIYFMAPEQFERSPVDARTDLYSLGCVYYFALTQHYPFQGETGPEVMASHMYHSMIPLAQLRPDLPAEICAWVEWLMSRDPEQRAMTAGQAHEWFQAGQAPTLASPVTEAEAIALAEPDDEDIATALPEDEQQPPSPSQAVPPRYHRPGGSTSQHLRPTAPKPTRPVPGMPAARTGTRPVPKPVIRPVNIVSAAAPEHLRHKPKLPKWLTVGMPLTLALIAAVLIGLKFYNDARDTARFKTLAAQSSQGQVAGTLKDLRMLFRKLEDPESSTKAGEIIGKLTAGDLTDDAVAAAVRATKTAWARKNIALAIEARGTRQALEPLLQELEVAKVPEVRIAIWRALGRIATPVEVPRLLDKYQSDDVEEIGAAEGAISRAAIQEGDLSKRSSGVLVIYRAKTRNEDIQAALLRTLGRLGSPEALKDLTEALRNSSNKLRMAATFGLGEWPTAKPIGHLQTLLKDETDRGIRVAAYHSISKLAPLSGTIPQEDLTTFLKTAYEATKESLELNAIVKALVRVTEPGAATVVQGIATNDKDRTRKRDAADAMKSINVALGKVVVLTGNDVLQPSGATDRPLVMTLDQGTGPVNNWPKVDDQIGWLVKIDQKSEYAIKVSQAYAGSAPGRFAVTFGDTLAEKPVEKTGSNAEYREVSAGTARFEKPGHYRIWIRPLQITPGDVLMRLKQVTLTKL
jgi:serine/threonine protein kinase/HEAT repeat protein